MGGAAGADLRPERSGDRIAGGQPDAVGDRAVDRILRQHAGAADRCLGLADGGRTVGASQEANAGGAAASGHTVRAGSGDHSTAAESGALTSVSSGIRLAERSRWSTRSGGANDL